MVYKILICLTLTRLWNARLASLPRDCLSGGAPTVFFPPALTLLFLRPWGVYHAAYLLYKRTQKQSFHHTATVALSSSRLTLSRWARSGTPPLPLSHLHIITEGHYLYIYLRMLCLWFTSLVFHSVIITVRPLTITVEPVTCQCPLLSIFNNENVIIICLFPISRCIFSCPPIMWNILFSILL